MKQQLQVTTLTLETIDLFRSSLLAKGKSEATAKAYTTDLRVLLTQLETEGISEEDYEECGMNWLTATRRRDTRPDGVVAKTTVRRLTSLKQFALFAGWQDASFAEYAAPTPLPAKPHPIPEGVNGVKRMIFYARSPQEVALVTLCGLLGLRVGEARGTRPEYFDTTSRVLIVHGKGDKVREVPVGSFAWDQLKLPIVEASYRSTPVCPFEDRAARGLITRLGRVAGISNSVASHDLRATFATEVYDKTRDIVLVQRLLGHSSSKQTELYIGRTLASLRNGVEL